jgi:death-on-curing protein
VEARAAALTFIVLNDYMPIANHGTLYTFVMNVAAGEIDETGAAAFLRDYIEPV